MYLVNLDFLPTKNELSDCHRAGSAIMVWKTKHETWSVNKAEDTHIMRHIFHWTKTWAVCNAYPSTLLIQLKGKSSLNDGVAKLSFYKSNKREGNSNHNFYNLPSGFRGTMMWVSAKLSLVNVSTSLIFHNVNSKIWLVIVLIKAQNIQFSFLLIISQYGLPGISQHILHQGSYFEER